VAGLWGSKYRLMEAYTETQVREREKQRDKYTTVQKCGVKKKYI